MVGFIISLLFILIIVIAVWYSPRSIREILQNMMNDVMSTLQVVVDWLRDTIRANEDGIAREKREDALKVQQEQSIQSRNGDKQGGKDVVKDLSLYPRSKAEAGAVKELESILGVSCPTVNPDWLVWKGKTLELDGYCHTKDGKKVALEFSGPLHTKWSPHKEPYEQYFARIVKDIVKRKMCKRHGVVLIVIDMTLPRYHFNAYIKSRLYDAGLLQDEPRNYIAYQKAKPFRNKQLEKELNLYGEIKAAKSL